MDKLIKIFSRAHYGYRAFSIQSYLETSLKIDTNFTKFYEK